MLKLLLLIHLRPQPNRFCNMRRFLTGSPLFLFHPKVYSDIMLTLSNINYAQSTSDFYSFISCFNS